VAAVDPLQRATSSTGGAKPRVVVVGGGFAGLETAFSLRMRLDEEIAITLVSDEGHFYFRPGSIQVPFGLDPQQLRLPLDRPARRKDISLVRATAHGVDAQRRRLETDHGTLEFDFLVIATGSRMHAGEIPGLDEHALGIWSAREMLELRACFDRVLENARHGPRRRVLFLVPPRNMCAGPLYEIALMLEGWLRERGARGGAEIVWTTAENRYIEALGPRLHDVVAEEFERRGIAGHTGYAVCEVTAHEVRYRSGETLAYDHLISFAPHVATNEFAGLPADDRGFIETHPASREVIGNSGIYAVGDAGAFPAKQAVLALLQGDAAAAHIAPRIFGRHGEGSFDPVSTWVMEELDKASFIQVPLRLSGDPEHPVEVRPGAESDYLLGSSPAWRTAKAALARTVLWRFGRGEPFHAGGLWGMMGAGLRGLSRLFATAAPGASAGREPARPDA
jgi:NADH dehydrogenase FAD-containing subunit